MNAPGIRSPAVRLLSISVLAVAALVVISPNFARAGGGNAEAARAFFDKASASFALGHYPEAAENFEKAFENKPDSALLYNAAQAHRLAGDKERALILYQNYLRIYTKAPLRAEVEIRVDELKRAIERDRVVATTPPTTTLPSSTAPVPAPEPPTSSAVAAKETTGATSAFSAPPPPAVDLRPSSARSPPPVLVTQRREPDAKPLTSKPLFWVAVAGGTVGLIAIVVVLALSGPQDPSASLGVVR
jgi:hypothetical protein